MMMKAIFYSGVFGLLMLGVVIASGCKKDTKKDDPLAPTTVKDIDGNVYPVVKVGEQYWMGENLRVTRYRNGDIIPTTTPLNKNLYGSTGMHYQWPHKHEENLVKIWGRVYSAAVITDIRGLCPQSWRVSTVDDFNLLLQYLQDHQPSGYNSYNEMFISPDPSHWQFPSHMIGTPKNSTGLSFLGGGIRVNFANADTSSWLSDKKECYLSAVTPGATLVKYFNYNIASGMTITTHSGGGPSPAAHVRCVME